MLSNVVISFVYSPRFLLIIVTFLAWLELYFYVRIFIVIIIAACCDCVHFVVSHDAWFTNWHVSVSAALHCMLEKSDVIRAC